MTRRVLYMAHPLAPTEMQLVDLKIKVYGSGVGLLPDTAADRAELVKLALDENIGDALTCLGWLRRSFPETTFIAPWIAGVQSVGGDGTPAERAAGLVDDCAVVERCDGIVLMGGRISSGMATERDHGVATCRALAESWSGSRGSSPEDAFSFDVYDLTSVLLPTAGCDWVASTRGPGTCPDTFEEWAACFLVVS